MPRMERSPPSSSGTDIVRGSSTSDITEVQSDPEFTNVSSRSKRQRLESSPLLTKATQSLEDRIMGLLTTWKKEQDASFEKLTSDIAVVKQQNVDIQRVNYEIEKSLDFINQGFESMKNSIDRLEKERVETQNHIMDLEKKIEDLQRLSRSSALEIRNVPAEENETNERLASIVLKTCDAVRSTISQSDLRDVYRLPGKKGLTRPIIVEFQSVLLKNKVLEACRTFNKERPPLEKLNTEHLGHGAEARGGGGAGGRAAAAGDAQQGAHVEREQPGVPAGLRRPRHAGVRQELPDRVPRETGDAVRAHRRQRVHPGLPVSVLGAAGLRRRARQRHAASQVNSVTSIIS